MSFARPTHADAAHRVPATALTRFVPSKYGVAAAAVLGAIFIVGLAPHLDTDIWWHLRTGAYIAAHHAVPTRDPFSFTASGKPWTDYEWLSELGMYGLYVLGGLWGPIVAFAVVTTGAFGIVYLDTVGAGVNRLLAAFLVMCAFGACSAIIGARIQMLTLLFLAMFASILRAYIGTRNRRLLLALPAIMLIWANMHGGYPLGIALVAAWLLGEWLNSRSPLPDSPAPADLRALAAALVATGAVTAINPNGVRQLLFPFTLATPNAFTNHINEWVSPDFHMPQMMVFEALLLLLLATAFLTGGRTDWTALLVTSMATFLALSQGRNVAVWVVLVTPFLASRLQSLVHRRPHSRNRLPVPERPLLNLLLLAVTAALFAVEAAQFIGPTALAKGERDSFPSGAAAYMATHHLPPNLLTAYAWGGYALWKLSPRYRDFIDGRANAVFDARLLYAYLGLDSGEPGWQRVLSQYRVEDVLIPPTSPLAQLLALDPKWRRVYVDRQAVVYTIRASCRAAQTCRFGRGSGTKVTGMEGRPTL